MEIILIAGQHRMARRIAQASIVLALSLVLLTLVSVVCTSAPTCLSFSKMLSPRRLNVALVTQHSYSRRDCHACLNEEGYFPIPFRGSSGLCDKRLWTKPIPHFRL